ncbi:hypothetical protein AALO_G00099500 [Alosa alosa]|uniref:Thyroglobulin type-1 domain-containing protein n=1 Tax=Alosa alosa TaxID=278164 RepID=A0AAV6GVJ4_9TELE|nr:hypothetical protein AALO_G00099500 [Alosa alosa]
MFSAEIFRYSMNVSQAVATETQSATTPRVHTPASAVQVSMAMASSAHPNQSVRRLPVRGTEREPRPPRPTPVATSSSGRGLPWDSLSPPATSTVPTRPMQCHGSLGQCWCVDREGQEITGTRTGPGSRPSCIDQGVPPTPVGPTPRPDVSP